MIFLPNKFAVCLIDYLSVLVMSVAVLVLLLLLLPPLLGVMCPLPRKGETLEPCITEIAPNRTKSLFGRNTDLVLFGEMPVMDGANVSPYPGKGHINSNNGRNSNSNNNSATTLNTSTNRYSIKHAVNNKCFPRRVFDTCKYSNIA